MAPVERKRPKESAKDGSIVGKRKARDDDDDLLSVDEGSWTESLLVLSFAEGLVRLVVGLVGKGSGGQTPSVSTSSPAASSKKKEKEKEVLPPKEAFLQFVNEYKLPVFLLVIFALTCLMIIAGEGYQGAYREERNNEAKQDHYGILGVARDAETADVKRAYKTLAKRWHPDKNPNCTSCAETFSKIAEAYETLADQEKRSAYDDSGDIATTELKSPRSVPLTRDNFDEMVTFSNDVWIVQIFKPGDGHCAAFHPFWENQIQKNGHLVRFGRVDVTSDIGKWLPVKVRVLPLVLKFGRHLTTPEIFPITSMHETPQLLHKFVITSFPNIGLPIHSDKAGLTRWLGSSSRMHKVLFAIPGKSEEERYKSHLVPRMLAARWSEIFEFRTAETAALHGLPDSQLPSAVRAALPSKDAATNKAAVIFFGAGSGSTPKASAVFPWPTGEDELVLELIRLAELAAPALSARSAELLCRSLAIRRIYCLVMLDPPDASMANAVEELKDSRAQYMREVAEIRAGGGDVAEDEDNFVVPAVRLFRQRRGIQPSVATCRTPLFQQVEKVLDGANAMLMDLDTGRVAALKGLTSFRGLYPRIAYEDSLTWVDDAMHPFLSLPDCNEGLAQHTFRALRSASYIELFAQTMVTLILFEAIAKAATKQSLSWALGAAALLIMMLLRSPPFLRAGAAYMPSFMFSAPLLAA